MARTKLENQIREKLNAREIQPSAPAWDRLDAMLTVAESKKAKPSYGWLYIAASILVLGSLGVFLFNPKNTEIDTQNNVVNVEAVKDSIKGDKIQIEAPSNKTAAVASSENQNQSNNNQTSINQSVSIINQKTTNSAQKQINQKSTNNPLINRDKEIEFLGSSDVAIKDLPKIEERTAITIPRKSVSDEQLLAELDKTAKESANKSTNFKVDPKSLLSQVDGELDQTFREKVISKVRKNYKEVKVALANRNNE